MLSSTVLSNTCSISFLSNIVNALLVTELNKFDLVLCILDIHVCRFTGLERFFLLTDAYVSSNFPHIKS